MVAPSVIVALVIGFLAGFGFCALWALCYAAKLSGKPLPSSRPPPRRS
jgi:hypothetical protein